ncbi:MAG: glycosyltransferase [Bacilli bacterium]|nr:glycosyltransferase [Bacilli bacterium]
MKKVSIVLSIYEPNLKYLKKQLQSLERQTYKNIEVVIRDDCPKNKTAREIFDKYLPKTKHRILPSGKKRLGYTKSFEELVKKIDHDGYIAFCDQDDIWDKKKIEYMVNALENSNMDLAICDRQLIDGDDKVFCESESATFKGIRRTWTKGKDIYEMCPFLTIAPGMSIICKASFAKKCLPYYPFAFDKYLTCCAAFESKILKVDIPLVQYRRHGKNVSGVLNGISTKNDYYEQRVLSHHILVNKLASIYKNVDTSKMVAFSNARVNKNIFKIFQYRRISPAQAKFEIILALTPNFVFEQALKIKRRG